MKDGKRLFPRGYDSVVSVLEDGGVGVFVDGNDVLRGAHASEMLDGAGDAHGDVEVGVCLLYTSPSPRDSRVSRMPSSA